MYNGDSYKAPTMPEPQTDDPQPDTCTACRPMRNIQLANREHHEIIDGQKVELHDLGTAYEQERLRATRAEAIAAAFRSLCLDAQKAAQEAGAFAGYSTEWHEKLQALLKENTDETPTP